jgi:hypothetical protein
MTITAPPHNNGWITPLLTNMKVPKKIDATSWSTGQDMAYWPGLGWISTNSPLPLPEGTTSLAAGECMGNACPTAVLAAADFARIVLTLYRPRLRKVVLCLVKVNTRLGNGAAMSSRSNDLTTYGITYTILHLASIFSIFQRSSPCHLIQDFGASG